MINKSSSGCMNNCIFIKLWFEDPRNFPFTQRFSKNLQNFLNNSKVPINTLFVLLPDLLEALRWYHQPLMFHICLKGEQKLSYFIILHFHMKPCKHDAQKCRNNGIGIQRSNSDHKMAFTSQLRIKIVNWWWWSEGDEVKWNSFHF